MGSLLPQIQCHASAMTMNTCHVFAHSLTAFAFTWQPAGAIQAQFTVALTLTPTT